MEAWNANLGGRVDHCPELFRTFKAKLQYMRPHHQRTTNPRKHVTSLKVDDIITKIR